MGIFVDTFFIWGLYWNIFCTFWDSLKYLLNVMNVFWMLWISFERLLYVVEIFVETFFVWGLYWNIFCTFWDSLKHLSNVMNAFWMLWMSFERLLYVVDIFRTFFKYRYGDVTNRLLHDLRMSFVLISDVVRTFDVIWSNTHLSKISYKKKIKKKLQYTFMTFANFALFTRKIVSRKLICLKYIKKLQCIPHNIKFRQEIKSMISNGNSLSVTSKAGKSTENKFHYKYSFNFWSEFT